MYKRQAGTRKTVIPHSFAACKSTLLNPAQRNKINLTPHSCNFSTTGLEALSLTKIHTAS